MTLHVFFFQVNVPNDLAANIINSLAQNGPTRGLFHDAIFLIFPALNHFWKKYDKLRKHAHAIYSDFFSFKN